MKKIFIMTRYYYDWYEFKDEIAGSVNKQKLIDHFHSLKIDRLELADMTTEEGQDLHLKLENEQTTHYGIHEVSNII